MTNIKVFQTKSYSGKKIVSLEIRPEFNKETQHQLRIWGYKWSPTKKAYHMTFNTDANGKQLIKSNIEYVVSRSKYYKIEQFKLVKTKTNVTQFMINLGIEV